MQVVPLVRYKLFLYTVIPAVFISAITSTSPGLEVQNKKKPQVVCWPWLILPYFA